MKILSFLYEYGDLVLPPVVGTVIGWLTNYVALKLLFRPHHPKKILGLKFQGLIPKRRREIARSIARTIEKELLNSKDLAVTLNNINWKKEVERMVEEVVDHRFGSEAVKRVPVIGLVTENLRYHIKYLITREVLRHIDDRKVDIAEKFARNVDVKELLASRIDELDLKRFEGLLTGFIAKELRHIEQLGGVMGFIIGLFQSGIFYVMR